MTSVTQDVRYSLRVLLKHKGFTVVAQHRDVQCAEYV